MTIRLQVVVTPPTPTPRPVLAIEVDGRPAFHDVATCTDPAATGPRLFFQRVPEPETAKNRMHLDLQVGPTRAVTTTLRDPEANGSCVS